MTTRRPFVITSMLALALPLCAQGQGGEKAPKENPAARGAADEKEAEAPRPDDAAPAYRQLVAAMRAQFGERFERVPEHEDLDGVPSEREATSEPWRHAVVAAAPVFEQWQLAIGKPRCRFRPKSAEPLTSEFVEDLLWPLNRFRDLAVARGLQAIADRDADVAVATVDALLAHALHLQQEPGLIAWAVAAAAEQEAADLHDKIARSLDDAAKERSRASIRRHLERRGGIAAAGAAGRIELFRLFDGAVEDMQRGTDAKAKYLREMLTDVRRHFTAIVDPFFAPLERTSGDWTPEQSAAAKQQFAEFRARLDKQRKSLLALRDGKDVPAGVDAPAELGLMLASLMMPSLEGFTAQQQQARDRLAAAAR